jgi:5'-3' exonuclease
MGIDNFFKSFAKTTFILKRTNDGNGNPQIERKQNRDIKESVKKIDCDRLYIDFNSVLYTIANNIEKDVQYIQYAKIIGKIDNRCREIMRRIDPNFDLCDDTMTKDEWLIEFKNHVKNSINDQYILESIRDYIDNIMHNLVTGDRVERIFISIDGIPTMTKIVEQKKRRIMTYLTNELKKKTKAYLKSEMSAERILYETHVYTFDRYKIIPMSAFMDTLCLYLTSDGQFQSWMKTRYVNLKEIIVSSHHLSGEGEKKIMEDIISSNYNTGECVIFSPDADIIIMSMLIRNILNRRATLDLDGKNAYNRLKKTKPINSKTKMISKVSMIRYNSYDDNYDYISADNLCRDIFNYVQGKTFLNLDEDRVTNDVGFLFTLFGNDFVPKLEAINVRTDIELILDTYVQTLEITHLSRHFGMYIIYHNRSKYRINYASFAKYFELLSSLEILLIKERYLSNTYRNYKRLKYLFEEDTKKSDRFESKLLYPRLVQYVQFANIILSARKKFNEIWKHETAHNESASNKTKIISNILMSYVQSEICHMMKDMSHKQFELVVVNLIETFVRIEALNLSICEIRKMSITEGLEKIIDEVIDNADIKPTLNLIPDVPDIKSYYHQQNIKKQFPHFDMKISSYDETMYMMNRCIGNYKDVFTPVYKIGYSHMTTKSEYKYKSSHPVTDAKEYYQRYFGVDINSKDPKVVNIMNHIASEYLKGLFWVFNFYMNQNDVEFNKKNTSDWFYPYSHAPLMFHISGYIFNMNKNGWGWIDKLYDSVSNTSYIPRSHFMTKTEYHLYVNPYQKLNQRFLGEQLYNEICKVDHTLLFGDMDRMVDKIWEGDDSTLDVRYTYLSRGKLIGQKNLGYGEWKSLLESKGVYIGMDNTSLYSSTNTLSITHPKNLSVESQNPIYNIWESDPLANAMSMIRNNLIF